MKEIDKYHTVAKFVRIERDVDTDDIYIVFQVIDEKFKKKIKHDWSEDVPLKLLNDNRLVTFEEE